MKANPSKPRASAKPAHGRGSQRPISGSRKGSAGKPSKKPGKESNASNAVRAARARGPTDADAPTTKRKLRPLRVAVLASGRGSNLQALLKHIKGGWVNAEVTLVLSDVPGAGALDIARKAGVAATMALPPEEGEKGAAYNARLVEVLLKEAPELIILAGYMRILGAPVLAAFPNRIINIHPGLLPSFKGLHAVQQAMDAGVGIAGCSTHFVTGDLDGGPIILQAAIPVRPDEALADLQRRILHLEHLVLPRTVHLFAEGRVRNEDGKARIAPGPSWLESGPEPIAGALYSEGY